ncbi:MAG: glycosyltransferase family 9 protein [Fidelibacterota bacterium]
MSSQYLAAEWLKKCLIIRFSSIGDIILTTSVIEYLGRASPGCEIHFLTLSDFAPILRGNRYLSRVILVERDAKLNHLRQLAHELESSGYTVFLDLHNSLRSRYLRSFLSRERWAVYRKPRMNRFLLFNLHIDRFGREYDVLTEILKLVDGHRPNRPAPSPTLYISQQEKERCRRFLAAFGVEGDFVVAIPGAAWSTKLWLMEGYVKVLDSVLGIDALPVVILGGQGDAICDGVASALPGAVNLKGKTDLRTSLSILACAAAAIGSDTGLTHGAEAVGTPVVMLTGPTSHETGARVRDSRSVELSAGPWCRPCSKNGSRPCYRREQVCMTGIDADRAEVSLRAVLSRRSQ